MTAYRRISRNLPERVHIRRNNSSTTEHLANHFQQVRQHQVNLDRHIILKNPYLPSIFSIHSRNYIKNVGKIKFWRCAIIP